jgi:hypothetical protein
LIIGKGRGGRDDPKINRPAPRTIVITTQKTKMIVVKTTPAIIRNMMNIGCIAALHQAVVG